MVTHSEGEFTREGVFFMAMEIGFVLWQIKAPRIWGS